MARIAGVDLPRNKQTRIALTYIFGIGLPRARKIAATASVDGFKKISDLTEDEVNRIRQVIENEGNVEGDLRKDIHDAYQAADRNRLVSRLSSSPQLAGSRAAHAHQCATRKGPRKGTVANKKKTAAKT